MALLGWSGGVPAPRIERETFGEAAAVAADMVKNKHWCAAGSLLLMFDLYLRPGEAFSLQVPSAAPPMIEGGKSAQFLSCTV